MTRISLENLRGKTVYKDLNFYTQTDSAEFKGRSEEVEDLTQLIIDHPLTVIYGQSGVGKTSLINAGIFKNLPNSFLPVYIRIDLECGSPYDQTFWSLKSLYGEKKKESRITEPKEGELLWEYLKRVSDERHIPVLIFDQFEEFLKTSSQNEEADSFLKTLNAFIENRIPSEARSKFYLSDDYSFPTNYKTSNLRIVLSLREDYLPLLNEKRIFIKSIFKNTFRVRPFGVDEAREIIEFPNKLLQKGDEYISEDSAKSILSYLTSEEDSEDRWETGSSTDLYYNNESKSIEPIFLSIVCTYLKKKFDNSDKIANDDSKRLGLKRDWTTTKSLKKLVNDFYLNKTSGYKIRTRRFIEEHLVHKVGVRTKVSLESANAYFSPRFKKEPTYGGNPGVLHPELQRLEKDRLIKKFKDHAGNDKVELVHDRLIQPVIFSSRKRRNKRRAYITSAVVALCTAIIAYTVFTVEDADQLRKDVFKLKQEKLGLVTGYDTLEKRVRQLSQDAVRIEKEAKRLEKRANEVLKDADEKDSIAKEFVAVAFRFKQKGDSLFAIQGFTVDSLFRQIKKDSVQNVLLEKQVIQSYSNLINKTNNNPKEKVYFLLKALLTSRGDPSFLPELRKTLITRVFYSKVNYTGIDGISPLTTRVINLGDSKFRVENGDIAYLLADQLKLFKVFEEDVDIVKRGMIFSPKNNWAYAYSRVNETLDLYEVSSNGKLTLTNSWKNVLNPIFSQEGDYLAFYKFNITQRLFVKELSRKNLTERTALGSVLKKRRNISLVDIAISKSGGNYLRLVHKRGQDKNILELSSIDKSRRIGDDIDNIKGLLNMKYVVDWKLFFSVYKNGLNAYSIENPVPRRRTVNILKDFNFDSQNSNRALLNPNTNTVFFFSGMNKVALVRNRFETTAEAIIAWEMGQAIVQYDLGYENMDYVSPPNNIRFDKRDNLFFSTNDKYVLFQRLNANNNIEFIDFKVGSKVLEANFWKEGKYILIFTESEVIVWHFSLDLDPYDFDSGLDLILALQNEVAEHPEFWGHGEEDMEGLLSQLIEMYRSIDKKSGQ